MQQPQQESDKHFVLKCGDNVAHVRYDANGIPYLSLVDDRDNVWHIYGYATVDCQCGETGAWYPGELALAKMVAAYSKRNELLERLIAELKTLM